MAGGRLDLGEGKEIMIKLGEATKSLIDKLRPKASDFAAVEYNLPVQPVFRERNFLICRGARAVSVALVDDMGSCLNPGVHDRNSDGSIQRKDWHSYRFYESGRSYASAVRCPASLSHEERLRLEQDIPHGRKESRLASVRAEGGRQGDKGGKTEYDAG